MSWSFLTHLLEEISLHSTYLGKLWLTTFLILRIMLTIAAGESIYHDEQSSFMCNSQQPGCTNVCYDSFAPLSYVRFWIFQIITVAAPSILYLAFAIHRIQRSSRVHSRVVIRRSEGSTGHKKHRRTEQAEENVQAEKGGEFADEAGEVKKNDHRWHDGRRAIRADGLMWAYTLQLVLRTVAEVGFLLGQYVMYGLEVIPRFECPRRHPCRHRVDCFVSRPTEKTVFLYVMYAVGGLSLALDLAELWHLGMGALGDLLPGSRAKRQQRIANGDPPPPPPPPPPRRAAETEEAAPRQVAITPAAASQLQGYLRAIQRRLELTVSPPPRRARATRGYGESGAGRGGGGGEGGRRETPALRSAAVAVSKNPQVQLGKKYEVAAAADEVGDSGEEQGEVKAASRKGRAVRTKKYPTISV
uniref:Gap junction protein n=1 Tax=Petromyzon marinus TaxID=7757 RepID=A0AAJ7WJQ0_PETMA|nr:gap junction gamma-1 protein-like [Petromyzon marinus]